MQLEGLLWSDWLRKRSRNRSVMNSVSSYQRPACSRVDILLKMDKWLKRRKFNDDNSDNDNAQVASYEIAELIAVNLKPHNLAEEIILPACRKIVKTMIGGSADIDICKIPLSNDTIHRRIKDMSENIEQNTAKTLANSNFALQVNETTDITGNVQLIAFVRFIHENDIINQFLCCRELTDFTTGKHIFQVISSYLEEIKVSWKSCIVICTDGAPAMTGHLKGFVAHVKELNENILVTHCFLHREALVTKFLPSDLKIVLEQCVKMVNYIKSRPFKSRLFSKLCQAMEAKYEYLLLHTEVDRDAAGSRFRNIDYNLSENICYTTLDMSSQEVPQKQSDKVLTKISEAKCGFLFRFTNKMHQKIFPVWCNTRTRSRSISEPWDRFLILHVSFTGELISSASFVLNRHVLMTSREDREGQPCLTVSTATAGSDVVQSGRPIFDYFFQHLCPYIGNNTANVVFQMVKRLWLIRIDQ
ncbi:zinc finger BED domain-containing protein 5 [Trichonephila clavipes]|nr:zinc finger BED domain-containing protein 5 [Trichonephila clavipes]